MLPLSIGEDILETRVLLDTRNNLNRLKNDTLLSIGLLVVDRSSVESGKDPDSLFLATVVQQPSGGLGENDCTSDKKDSEDDLEGNRETPLGAVIDEGHSKIEPVSDNGSDSNHSSLDANEKTTIVRLGAFSLPDGNSRSVGTITNSLSFWLENGS
jgi:hypothetical protein